MEKFNWMTVLEILVAGVLVGLVIAIISGPLHRMAAHMHGHRPDGRAADLKRDSLEFEGHFERAA